MRSINSSSKWKYVLYHYRSLGVTAHWPMLHSANKIRMTFSLVIRDQSITLILAPFYVCKMMRKGKSIGKNLLLTTCFSTRIVQLVKWKKTRIHILITCLRNKMGTIYLQHKFSSRMIWVTAHTEAFYLLVGGHNVGWKKPPKIKTIPFGHRKCCSLPSAKMVTSCFTNAMNEYQTTEVSWSAHLQTWISKLPHNSVSVFK